MEKYEKAISKWIGNTPFRALVRDTWNGVTFADAPLRFILDPAGMETAPDYPQWAYKAHDDETPLYEPEGPPGHHDPAMLVVPDNNTRLRANLRHNLRAYKDRLNVLSKYRDTQRQKLGEIEREIRNRGKP